MRDSDDEQRPVGLGAEFRAAMRRVASTVTVITVGSPGIRHGMTATSVTSLCVEPPSMLVCVNRQAALHALLLQAGRFTVNVLAVRHAKLSAVFAGGLKGDERFSVGDWRADELGVPYLNDAQANIRCTLSSSTSYGTHTVFIGSVNEVIVREEIEPLIYQNAGYVTALSHVHG